METIEKEQEKQPEQSIRLERIFGIILLIPPIIGVLLFMLNLFSDDLGKMSNLSHEWTGDWGSNGDGGGGGYTSAAPIYLGLMAIAGALLLKGTDKK